MIAISGIITNGGLCGVDNDGKVYYVMVTANAIGILGCISLLFGAYKSHKIAVLVYLITDAIQVILWITYAIWFLVVASKGLGAFGFLAVLPGVAALIFTVVWIYFWLCVFSFFKKINERPDGRS